MKLIVCKICSKSFKDKNYPPKPRKFCSTKCYAESLKLITGSNSPNWLGDKAGYMAIHQWLIKNYGTPSVCEINNNHKHTRYEWANLNGEMKFKRDKSHYIRLCKSCHIRFDYGLIGIKKKNKVYIRYYRFGGLRGITFDKSKNKWVVRFQEKFIGRYATEKEALDKRKECVDNLNRKVYSI